VRSEESARLLHGMGLTSVVVGDIATDDWHSRLPTMRAQAVFSVSSGGGDIAAYRRVYRDGMASALRWAAQGVDTLVYTSSTGVYLQGDGATVDETSPVGGDEKSDVLVETENLLLEAPELAPLGRFVLRFGGLYGPGRHYLLDALRRGDRIFPGSGAFHLNYLHRDDAVSAIFAALDAPRSLTGGVYNVTDGNPALKSAIVNFLADELGLPHPGWNPEVLTGRAARRGAGSPDRLVLARKIAEELEWYPRHLDFRSGYASIMAGGA
jgi:nucleoside-diphosphate-sugar epimerase